MVRIIVVGQGDSETKEDSDNRRLSETEQLKAAMIGERLKKESAAKEYKLYTPDISRPQTGCGNYSRTHGPWHSRGQAAERYMQGLRAGKLVRLL